MSHSYPPAADNAAYLYARNQRSEIAPTQSQYYEDNDGYKRAVPHFWTQRMPNPGSVACNSTVTLPRRLATPSPRLKRSQCLSVQAPLHGSPQEYHLIPHQTGNLHPPIPTGSPRPGRSPSPGIDRVAVQYSPQPYPKFAPHFQTPPYSQGYPITTQPMNTVHFPPPMPNLHTQYQGNFPPPSQMYPTMPPSPRMKQTAHQFMMSTVDDSALISRPYPMLPPPVVHGSNYYPPSGQGNLIPGTSLDPYSQALQSTVNQDVFTKTQETEYGVMPSSSLQYRSGSIPAHIQNIENCDVNGIQHLNRSVPSINIIPSTSPPTSAYLTSSENWRGDSNKVVTNNAKMELSSSPKLKSPEDHTFNHTVPLESNKTLISSEEKARNEMEKESVNATGASTSSLQHKTDEDTPVTVHNSYTVLAPKPSKIIPQQITTESCNAVSNSKDVILSHNTNERPSVFRKPGCFQAVPVNIPSVHAALHRKESVESEAKQMHSKEDLKSKCNVVKDSKTENPESDEPKLVSNSSDIHCQDTLTNINSTVVQGTSSGFESKKQAGFVGGIVNYINKSLNVENKTSEVKQKSAFQNVQQIRPSSAPPEIVKKDNNRSEFSSKVLTKPGYPVQVKSDQNEQCVTAETKDQPPELPKKEKSLISMRNVALIPERSNVNSYEPSIKNYKEENRKLPPEKICQPSNSNKNLQQHSSALSDHSKENHIQNEIARENSKNMKITNYSLANKLPKQKELNIEKYTSEESKCSVENSKLRSSDKRFQKVLPPIDKNFQLKPCNARRSFSQGEGNSKDNDNQICTEQRNTELEENNKVSSVAETTPPSIPPKTHSVCTDYSCTEKNVAHIPPSLPPKRSSVAIPTTSDLTLQNSKESSLSNDILHKPLENTSKAKLVSENTVTLIENDLKQNSLLQIDIIKMKDVNNEKNEQLQKENMPDLISRIIPNEKKELILAENQDKIINKEEIELAKDNNPQNEQTESIKYKNPESPKRQSWFFGTHKNSLVFPVIILKNPELGFSIEGGIGSPRNPGKPSDNGIYVAHVLENGPASNLLRPGDKILQVDGNDFTQLDHNKAVAVLQESGTTVSLMVSRE
ncbi:Leucine-rich repeat-containing protein 7, partial [Stegodyphus mimosarum]